MQAEGGFPPFPVVMFFPKKRHTVPLCSVKMMKLNKKLDFIMIK